MRIDFPITKELPVENNRDSKLKENKTKFKNSNGENSISEITLSNITSAKSGILEVEKAVKLVELLKKQIQEEVSSAIAAQANTSSTKLINIIK